METNLKLKKIIEEVLYELGRQDPPTPLPDSEETSSDDALRDPARIDLKAQLLVPHPVNPEAYLKLKQTTVARIGISHTGGRYLTSPYLRFRADHATAQDAVFNEVSDDFIAKWGLLEIKSRCENKDQFLTRPDLGRVLDLEQSDILRQKIPAKAQVQIYIADGLSSTAVEKNAADTFQAMVQGLTGYGIKVGTPFFLRYGRVPSMDTIAELLNPEVVALLIGERPGLATAESMSCYMAYRPHVGMPEANRTVLSNIHQGGTPAVEAGAHIADILKKILEQKASGLELKK